MLLNRAEALRENAQTGAISPYSLDRLRSSRKQLPPPVGLPGQGLPDNAPLPYPLPPPVNSGGGPLGSASVAIHSSPLMPGDANVHLLLLSTTQMLRNTTGLP